MICGYLPFEDQNTKKLYQKIIKAEFKLPTFISDEASDLLQLILNPEPSNRVSIEEIRQHVWFNQVEHVPPYTPAIFIGKDSIPVDEKIMGMLERDHTMERDTVIDNL